MALQSVPIRLAPDTTYAGHYVRNDPDDDWRLVVER